MSDDKVPYDENAWERIVSELSDSLPDLPPQIEPAPEPPEEQFVPPEPPALPRMDLISKLSWLGILGGPALLFAGVLVPSLIGPGLVMIGIAAFVVGFLTMVLRDPNEPEDGWDDGSVV